MGEVLSSEFIVQGKYSVSLHCMFVQVLYTELVTSVYRNI